MGRRPKSPRRYPSFFMVLIGDFSNKLLIPPALVKHFNGKIPRQSLLCGPNSERFWPVNVENLNGALFFNEGWKEFVHGNGLELGDFLVFHYVENDEFYVELYGKTCCQKKFVTAHPRKNNLKVAEVETKDSLPFEDELCQGNSQTRLG